MDNFHLQKTADGWAVYNGTGRVSGYYTQERGETRLETVISEYQQEQSGSKRSCMCCAETFRSQGIHHRLCNICRHKSEGLI